jgi:outer membrane protein
MKFNSPTFAKIALGAMLAGSLLACNNAKTDTKGAAAAAAPAVADKETTVYINQDTLVAKYDYAKDITKSMQSKGKSTQGDLQSRGQVFQQKVAEYQKNQATMSADQRQETEQRLQREKQDLDQYAQNAQAQFQNESASQGNKVFDKISDFVKSYAKEKGYKMVLMYSKANPTILYGDPSLDVTTDVLKRLNDAYAKDKK